MKKLPAICAAAGLILAFAGTAPATSYIPVASWDFEEGSGSTAHDGVNGHDATLKGNATWAPNHDGRSGYSLQLDGSGDYAEVPDHPDLNLLSPGSRLEAWVWLDDYNTNWSAVLAKRSGTEPWPGWQFVIGGSDAWGRPEEQKRLIFAFNGGQYGVIAHGQTEIQLDTWTHIAVEFDRPTLEVRFFVDDVQDPTTYMAADITSGLGIVLRIGNDTGPHSHEYALDGYLDDVKISVIPEPLTVLGMFLGLGSVGAYIRKRRMR